MSEKGFEGFKKQLQALKEKGADIDVNEIINDLKTPPGEKQRDDFESSFDRKAFSLMRTQVDKLLDDFENHYGPKGRGLSIAIHVQKENSADRYADTFNYIQDKLSIVHVVDIGTKGKYQPVDLAETEKIVQKAKKQVKERQKRNKNEV